MKQVAFGGICKLQNGRAFKPEEWSETGTPIIRIQNLNDENKPFNYCNFDIDSKFYVDSGDLLFSWSGTPGSSFGAFFWNRGKGFLNQHIFRVDVDDDKIDKKYLRYAINSRLNLIIHQAHGGVGLKHITKKKLEAVQIPLPPLKEQKRIAAILDKADSVRQKRQQAIKMADNFLRSVFLDMFGDPTNNPKGFPVGTIRDLLTEAKYGTAAKADVSEGEYPVLRMGNITYEGNWNLDDLKYLDLEEKEKPKYLAETGDLIFNRTNSRELVGKTAVYSFDYPMALAGYLIRARTNEKGNPYYISAYLNSRHGKQTLVGMCKSIVGMANINAQEMQDIKILIPPVELQEKYSDIESEVRQRLSKMSNFLHQSERIFSSISQSFFRGGLY